MTTVSHRTNLAEVFRVAPLIVLDEATVHQCVKALAFQGARCWNAMQRETERYSSAWLRRETQRERERETARERERKKETRKG